jgi:hypothetical protein
MLYVMNRQGIASPSRGYYETIAQGYVANGIPLAPLEEALQRSLRGR